MALPGMQGYIVINFDGKSIIDHYSAGMLKKALELDLKFLVTYMASFFSNQASLSNRSPRVTRL